MHQLNMVQMKWSFENGKQARLSWAHLAKSHDLIFRLSLWIEVRPALASPNW